jgi:hypothetical protein
VRLEEIGGLVAEELHGVAPLEKGEPLGGQALELDRTDFGTVLFGLGALLRVFVGVKLADDAFAGAMEEIDARPEEIVKVGFEAGVLECRDEGVKNVGEGAFDDALVG